jgi:hypothetical protein
MPRTPSRPDALRGRIFRGSHQVRRGLLTPAQLRSSAWQRLFPDVYACSTLTIDHRRRARAAARLLLPEATVSGRSAAVLWGVDLAGPRDDVELTLAPGCRAGAVRGIQVTRRVLTEDEVAVRSGVRVTTPLRTALDLARITPVEEAVVCLDRFVVAKKARLSDVVRAADEFGGPGCRHMRKAVGMADGLAGSPQETLRLIVHRSSLPRPVAQYQVHDGAGRFVARVDFAWPEAGVAVEYEGAWHAHNVGPDRRRLNELTATGWTVVRDSGRHGRADGARRPDRSGPRRAAIRISAVMRAR